MHTLTTWANRHDYAKLTLITLAMFPGMFMSLRVDECFGCLLLAGIALSGVVAYWLGNWKWIFIPLLADLVWIICAVLAIMGDPNAGETPASLVLEAPFWAGIPALIGAGSGYLYKRMSTV